MSIAANDTFATETPYYAGYVQEAWRATRALTVSAGLRFEFEQGVTERYDRMLVGWDPSLKRTASPGAGCATRSVTFHVGMRAAPGICF